MKNHIESAGSYKDLAKDEKENFVQIDDNGAFVRKEAKETFNQAEIIAKIASELKHTGVSSIDVLHAQAQEMNDKVSRRIAEILSELPFKMKEAMRTWGNISIKDRRSLYYDHERQEKYLKEITDEMKYIGKNGDVDQDLIIDFAVTFPYTFTEFPEQLKNTVGKTIVEKKFLSKEVFARSRDAVIQDIVRNSGLRFEDKNFVVDCLGKRWGENVVPFLSEDLKNDSEIADMAVSKNPALVEHLSEDLKNNKEFAEKILDLPSGHEAFQFLSEKLRNDDDVVAKVVKLVDFAQIVNFVGENLKQNSEFAYTIISKNPEYIGLFPETIRSNEELAMQILGLEQGSKCFAYLSEDLRDNEQFIEKAMEITDHDNILPYLGENLKNNEEFAKKILDLSPKNIFYFSDALKAKKEISEYVATNMRNGVYTEEEKFPAENLTPSLIKDKEFLLKYLDWGGYQERCGLVMNLPAELKSDKSFILEIFKKFHSKTLKYNLNDFYNSLPDDLKVDDEVLKSYAECHSWEPLSLSIIRSVEHSKKPFDNKAYLLKLLEMGDYGIMEIASDTLKSDEEVVRSSIDLIKRNKTPNSRILLSNFFTDQQKRDEKFIRFLISEVGIDDVIEDVLDESVLDNKQFILDFAEDLGKASWPYSSTDKVAILSVRDKEYMANKEFVEKLVEKGGIRMLSLAAPTLRKDKKFVVHLSENYQNYKILDYCDQTDAFNKEGRLFTHQDIEQFIKANPFALETAERYLRTYRHDAQSASEEELSLFKLALKSCKDNNEQEKFIDSIPDHYKAFPNIVLECIKINPKYIMNASKQVRQQVEKAM